MRSPAQTAFGAIFYTEVLLNSKRVAPYALIILFSANAVLWWGWGAAVHYGWATNSDFYIMRNFGGFSFLTLPFFTALIMGDPVMRDFRLGIDPLIFSKPIGRAQYLLGKFLGNFFVLVCCQAAFALTLIVLQAFHPPQMVVQTARVLPYFKHFFFLVIISHLLLAALYFTIGTLTRNARIVYGLAVSFYPLYISYQLLLKGMPPRWRVALDPLLFNWGAEMARGRSAEWLNQHTSGYDADIIANRALTILLAAACLTILYSRFVKAVRFKGGEEQSHATLLNLSTGTERIYNDASEFPHARFERHVEVVSQEKTQIPEVSATSRGFRANLKQLIAASAIEFRLLHAERSLFVLVPLAVFFSILEVAFYEVASEASYSIAYAGHTAKTLLLFLLGMTIFYTGEAMHRDRELRIEPVLWSAPVPDCVLLLSKYFATLALTLALVALTGLSAIALQLYRGHAPVGVSAYLKVYSVILFPGLMLASGVSVALNVLLRDKYLAYALSAAACIGLFYLYGQGYNHWLYNPMLYGLWTDTDFTDAGSNHTRILIHRLYCLSIASACLSLAHLCFGRKSTKRFQVNGRLSSAGWSILIVMVSVAAAVITGLLII